MMMIREARDREARDREARDREARDREARDLTIQIMQKSHEIVPFSHPLQNIFILNRTPPVS
jgi:hypothetical protein